MVILFASFIGFLLFIEISLLTSPVDKIMAIVLAFLTYAIGFFSLMIHFLEEQTVSARAGIAGGSWKRTPRLCPKRIWLCSIMLPS